jgi:hypothetical protein
VRRLVILFFTHLRKSIYYNQQNPMAESQTAESQLIESQMAGLSARRVLFTFAFLFFLA